MTYDDYGKSLQQYFAQNPYSGVIPQADPQAEISGYGQPAGYDEAQQAYQDYNTNIGQDWLNTLTPQQRAEYDQYHQQAVDANKKKANQGAMIAFGAPLLAAGAGALLGPGGFGALGGGAEAAGGAGGAIFNPAVDSQLASAAGGFSGLGGASLPSGVNLGSLGGIMPTGLAGAGIPIGGALSGIEKLPDVSVSGKVPSPTIPGQIPMPGKIPGIGSGGGINWGKLLGGAGIGAAALAAIQALQNRNKMPGLPNFTQLAEQTANSQNAAVNAQTLANRPNQMNAYGDTSTWTIGPDGRPMQTTQFSQANQQKLDQNNQAMLALQKQIAAQAGKPLQAPSMQTVTPTALTGLPEMGNAMSNALRTVRVV